MDIILNFGGFAGGLPVLPSSFKLKGEMNNTEVNINSIGTVNLLGKRGLQELEFSSFFPNIEHGTYDFCTKYSMPPYEYCELITRSMWENDIGQVTITGTDINLKCTIQSFEYGEEDGTGDVYYTISFKEYRNTGTSRVSKKTKKTIYKTKKGDTFYSISRRFYGNSAYAKNIRAANKTKKGKYKYKISYKFKETVKIVIPAVK